MTSTTRMIQYLVLVFASVGAIGCSTWDRDYVVFQVANEGQASLLFDQLATTIESYALKNNFKCKRRPLIEVDELRAQFACWQTQQSRPVTITSRTLTIRLTRLFPNGTSPDHAVELEYEYAGITVSFFRAGKGPLAKHQENLEKILRPYRRVHKHTERQARTS